VAPPTRAALPPEDVGAAASRIFDGAPTQAARQPDFTAANRKRVGGAAEGSTHDVWGPHL